MFSGKMGTNLKNAGLLAAAQEILDEENEILKGKCGGRCESEGEEWLRDLWTAWN